MTAVTATTVPKTKSDRTRARIADSARALFLEHGLDAVSIRDIAAAAGVTHALVHRYFGTREQLIATIVRREMDTTADALREALSADDPLAALRETIAYTFGAGLGFIRVSGLVQQAGLRLEDVVPPDPVRPFELLAARLAALRQDGASDAARQARITMLVIAAAIFGLASSGPWLLGGVGLDPNGLDQQRDAITQELLRIAATAAGISRPE